MNLFEKKAWKLKVIDDRGHQFFIQDLMDFDDIVRSSGKSVTPKLLSSASLVLQSNFATKFLGKKARKAKSWLKQLSTSSEEMDLTEHDLIYFGLEKRIRKIFSNFLLARESSVVREKLKLNPCKRKTHILVLQDIFQDTYARFDTIKCKSKSANFYVLNYRKIRYV